MGKGRDKMQAPGAPPGPRHEPSEVGIKGIAWFGLGLAIMVALIVVLTQVVLDRMSSQVARRAAPPAAVAPPEIPPEPRLQTTPREDLAALLAREDAVLESYGWVDRKAGVVRIPIDRAMELLAKRGLPVRGAEPAAPEPKQAPRTRTPARRKR